MRRSRLAWCPAVLALCVSAGAAGGSEWGYTATGGTIPPVDWGGVSSTCRTGRSQSPIAFSTWTADPNGGIAAPEIRYGVSDLVVRNNGHTIEAQVERGAGEIEIGGTLYELVQVHIHWRSEHMVDGELYAGELHLVHSDARGNLAVLGSLLRQGGSSKELQPYFRAARRLPRAGDEVEVHAFDLERLVPPAAGGYFHYSGSLTTPPCSEGVSWWIWDTTRTVSRGQLGNVRIGVPRRHNPQGNRRPVQPLNGRPVHRVDR